LNSLGSFNLNIQSM